jgi:MFS family permease
METLAMGAILTAFAIQLGASNFLIGLLAAIPHLSQLAQLPAMYTVDRVTSRRAVYTWSGYVARPMFLVIGLTVFLPTEQLALAVIVLAFTVRYVAGAYLSCAWNTWMRELVPDEVMGKVFGQRQKKMLGIGMVVSLLAAGFIDLWGRFAPWPETYAFAIVYTLAFFGGMYSVVTSRRITDVPATPHDHSSRMLARLREPFRHKNFRRLMVFHGSWNFAVNLAAPFFTVHMLRSMNLDLFVVITLATLSQLAAYFTVSHWGEVADRFSNKAVLRVCAPLFISCIFLWTFTTMPDMHVLTYPLLVLIHLATGLSNAGVTLASGNISLKLAPRGNATAYLATSSMVNATAAGTAAMMGGLTADLFASTELSFILRWHSERGAAEFNALDFTHWDFFFFFATAIGMYALHRLSLVQEEGEVHESVVFNHLREGALRTLRNISTVAGLRSSTDYPLDTLVESDGAANPQHETPSNDQVELPANTTPADDPSEDEPKPQS